MTHPRVLTEPFVRALKPAAPGKRYAISDALVPGLKVRVTDTGAKSYILWRRIDRQSQSASALLLAKVGTLTLADARTKARAWITMIVAGQDPRANERAQRAVGKEKADNIFSVVFETYLQRHVAGQRKARDVEREMRAELLPRWKDKPVAAITRRDVIAMVDEITSRGARYQAHNILGHARTFFNWAIEKDFVSVSPCHGIKPKRLIGPKKERQRVLSDAELKAFWTATERSDYPMGPLYRMLLLTGQRKTEVSGARWSEFNIPEKTWSIPPERFKSGSTQLVPLSDEVLTLLAELPRWAGSEFLFSANGRTPVVAFAKAKARLDALMGNSPPWTTHDLRRTLRTRLSELRVQDIVAEKIIGHGRKGLQRVYDQHNYLDQMREALTAWALRLRAIVDPPTTDNVVAIRSALDNAHPHRV